MPIWEIMQQILMPLYVLNHLVQGFCRTQVRSLRHSNGNCYTYRPFTQSDFPFGFPLAIQFRSRDYKGVCRYRFTHPPFFDKPNK